MDVPNIGKHLQKSCPKNRIGLEVIFVLPILYFIGSIQIWGVGLKYRQEYQQITISKLLSNRMTLTSSNT